MVGVNGQFGSTVEPFSTHTPLRFELWVIGGYEF